MESNGTQNVSQHPTFYFPDGDLVIQSSPDSGGTVTLFRVNKSVLAFNSTPFANMFADSSPKGFHDGIPLVEVHDNADEFAALLSALYDPSSLSFRRFDPDIPLQLSGVMKLAKKYQVDSIRKRVVDIMYDNWPQSFEQWLRFRSEMAIMEAFHKDTVDGLIDGKAFDDRIPEPAIAALLAREFDIKAVLPAIFYTLCGISSADDWDTHRRDITDYKFLAQTQLRTARWSKLGIADFKVVIRLREFLAHQLRGVMDYYGGNVERLMEGTGSPRCAGRGGCRKGTQDIVKKWKDAEEGLFEAINVGAPDPLDLLEQLYNSRPSWTTCENCQECMQERIRNDQNLAWNGLSYTVQNLLLGI